jgi:transcriptional regulator with XRE-family HTH domain
MEKIYAQTQLLTLQNRLRMIRESKKLTLAQVAALSKGQLSSIALGSYERGDRAVSANKLILIAELYSVPVTELFTPNEVYMSETRVSVDIRKILTTTNPVAQKLAEVIRNIARMRGDWNGEVISLRALDLNNLLVFTGLSVQQIHEVLSEYSFSRSK